MTVALHYEIGGSGPPVVLLHPVGVDLIFLAPVAATLRQDFTVLSTSAAMAKARQCRPQIRSTTMPATSTRCSAN